MLYSLQIEKNNFVSKKEWIHNGEIQTLSKIWILEQNTKWLGTYCYKSVIDFQHIIAYDLSTNGWIYMVMAVLDINLSKYIKRS